LTVECPLFLFARSERQKKQDIVSRLLGRLLEQRQHHRFPLGYRFFPRTDRRLPTSASVRAQCLVASTPRSAFRAEAQAVLAGLTGKLPAEIFAPPP